jgi:hypothetical protein
MHGNRAHPTAQSSRPAAAVRTPSLKWRVSIFNSIYLISEIQKLHDLCSARKLAELIFQLAPFLKDRDVAFPD